MGTGSIAGLLEAARSRLDRLDPMAADAEAALPQQLQHPRRKSLPFVAGQCLESAREAGVAYGARTRNLRSHNPMLCH
jgi:hypothetical protein